MPARLTRRSLLAGAWLRSGPVAPAAWAPVEAPTEAMPAAPANAIRRAPVRLDATRCLPFCRTCVERCPVPSALSAGPLGVAVDPAVCDGCGRCVDLCPSPGRPLSSDTR